MRWLMSWSETVRAAGLAVLAERPATSGRTPDDTPYRWDPYDVWLSRARSSLERADPSSVNRASGPRD